MSELKPFVNTGVSYPYYNSDCNNINDDYDDNDYLYSSHTMQENNDVFNKRYHDNNYRSTLYRSLLLFITAIGLIMIFLHTTIYTMLTTTTTTIKISNIIGNNKYNIFNITSLRSQQRLVYTSSILSLNLYKNDSVSDRYYVTDTKGDTMMDHPVFIVEGQYSLDVNHNGWNYLSIEALSSQYDDDDNDDDDDKDNYKSHHEQQHQYLWTMSAIGFMEGYLTCRDMIDWYANMYDGLFADGSISIESLHFLESNHQWMKEQADRYWLVDDYWLSVQGLLSQLDGLLEGTSGGCPFPTNHNHHANDDKNTKHTNDNDHNYYKGIYLPSFGSEGEVQLIHLLIANSNGDLFQIDRNLRGMCVVSI